MVTYCVEYLTPNTLQGIPMQYPSDYLAFAHYESECIRARLTNALVRLIECKEVNGKWTGTCISSFREGYLSCLNSENSSALRLSIVWVTSRQSYRRKGSDMSKSEMQRISEAAGYDCRSYSGRGMFGRNCLGIRVQSMNKFLADIVHYVNPFEATELSGTFRMMRTDNLGYDTILYFPGTEYAGYESDDSEESEEELCLCRGKRLRRLDV